MNKFLKGLLVGYIVGILAAMIETGISPKSFKVYVFLGMVLIAAILVASYVDYRKEQLKADLQKEDDTKQPEKPQLISIGSKVSTVYGVGIVRTPTNMFQHTVDITEPIRYGRKGQRQVEPDEVYKVLRMGPA